MERSSAMVSVFTFVSVCGCARPTEHILWPRNLNFGLKDPFSSQCYKRDTTAILFPYPLLRCNSSYVYILKPFYALAQDLSKEARFRKSLKVQFSPQWFDDPTLVPRGWVDLTPCRISIYPPILVKFWYDDVISVNSQNHPKNDPTTLMTSSVTSYVQTFKKFTKITFMNRFA